MSVWHRASVIAASVTCCLATASGASAQTSAPSGACCVAGANGAPATCSVLSITACFQAHGLFRGPNTTCDANTCVPPPPPTGACCVPGAAGTTPTCSVLSATACFGAHGFFRGPGTTCGANACGPITPPPPPTGACCIPGANGAPATCSVLSIEACVQAHGLFRGPNSACTATTCTPPPPPPAHGACCVAATATAGAHCFIGTAAACTTAGGTYGGDNSTCRSANCPAACACDWDHSGSVNPADLFAFLNDYLAGHGDFNGDGNTNQQDITDFLQCFHNPPAGCGHGGGAPILKPGQTGFSNTSSTNAN